MMTLARSRSYQDVSRVLDKAQRLGWITEGQNEIAFNGYCAIVKSGDIKFGRGVTARFILIMRTDNDKRAA